MLLIKKAVTIASKLLSSKKNAKSIGFVPTMGALHEGHISLINLSEQENDTTVCSIFINPTQFNDAIDFEKYPVTIEKDILLLLQNSADILFFPSVTEIYADGIQNLAHYNLGYIETILEGAHRPGHFQGVCQVVYRLLNIVQPDKIYVGQKDYQQYLIIKKLLQITGLKSTIVLSTTLREADGLAMSSRNMRLNNNDRKKAVSIFDTLLFIKHNYQNIDFQILKQQAVKKIMEAGFEKVDYAEIANAETLEPVNSLAKNLKLIALIAATINGVRLIDNILIN